MAATTIDTASDTSKAPVNRWDKVHATITTLRGEVTSRVNAFRKSVEAVRTQGSERVAAIRGDIQKLVESGKKFAENTAKDLQKLGDLEQLKAVVAKLQSKLEGLRNKSANAAPAPVVTDAPTSAAE